PRVRSVSSATRCGEAPCPHPPPERPLAARTLSAAATTARRATATVTAFAPRPFAAAVPALAAGFRLRHAFGPRQQRLHREAQPSTLVAIDQLDLHAIALLHDVLGLLGALVTHLGDVDQAFGTRHDLDERAERRRRLHDTLVRLADDRLRGERLDHLTRAFHRFAADGGDRHQTGVVDRELGA